jgi:hypothetical protein
LSPAVVIVSMRLAALVAVAACGGKVDPGSTLPAGQTVDVGGVTLEPSAAGLLAFVQTRAYTSWLAEPGVREPRSGSPHRKVRVFFNAASVEALRANAPALPVGSMIVKELYEADGSTLRGYVAMVKADARGWTWWETFAPHLDRPAVFGLSKRNCTGCHSSGGARDQVRTALPP